MTGLIFQMPYHDSQGCTAIQVTLYTYVKAGNIVWAGIFHVYINEILKFISNSSWSCSPHIDGCQAQLILFSRILYPVLHLSISPDTGLGAQSIPLTRSNRMVQAFWFLLTSVYPAGCCQSSHPAAPLLSNLQLFYICRAWHGV